MFVVLNSLVKLNYDDLIVLGDNSGINSQFDICPIVNENSRNIY